MGQEQPEMGQEKCWLICEFKETRNLGRGLWELASDLGVLISFSR